MSEPGLGEIFEVINELRGEVAALRAELGQRAPSNQIAGDELVWKWGRRPKFWSDLPVREAAIALHRRVTLDQAVDQLTEQFGPERAPSKSALGRLWLLIDRQPGRRA